MESHMAKPKDEPGATVDEQIEDSFPASDPPSYNAGSRIGRPKRKGEHDPAEPERRLRKSVKK